LPAPGAQETAETRYPESASFRQRSDFVDLAGVAWPYGKATPDRLIFVLRIAGDKYRRIYRAGDIMVYLDYVVTEVCGPKSVKFCEWEEADGTITIQRGKRKQTIKVKGGCGC
jgi:hypothetical protein